jgi:hypothetical protein
VRASMASTDTVPTATMSATVNTAAMAVPAFSQASPVEAVPVHR